MTDKSKLKGTKGGRKRPPHNATLAEHESFGDLLAKAAIELKSAEFNGHEVRLSRVELLFRQSIAGALDGSPIDVADVLQKMAKNPQLAASFREVITYYYHGAVANI